MTNKPYPLLVAPAGLMTKSRFEWTMQESKWNFDWIMGVMPQRIAGLLQYFGADRHAFPPRELLLQLGGKVADALLQDEFSEPREDATRGLTLAGHALAADMGLLTAQLLFEQLGDKIHWEIVRKPKRDVSFGLPVIRGFGKVYLEPIGGSIAEAWGILRGRRSGDSWLKTLDHWSAKAAQAS